MHTDFDTLLSRDATVTIRAPGPIPAAALAALRDIAARFPAADATAPRRAAP